MINRRNGSIKPDRNKALVKSYKRANFKCRHNCRHSSNFKVSVVRKRTFSHASAVSLHLIIVSTEYLQGYHNPSSIYHPGHRQRNSRTFAKASKIGMYMPESTHQCVRAYLLHIYIQSHPRVSKK